MFIGQFAVCLCFAELSARYPIAGAIYQWSRRVSSDPIGWMAGWLMQIGYIISVAAIAIALQAVLPEVWSGFQIVGGDTVTDVPGRRAQRDHPGLDLHRGVHRDRVVRRHEDGR